MNLILVLSVLISIFAAIGVVSVANPIHAILLLIIVFCFSGISMFSLNIEYISLLYIVVYIGAIAVLFLFVIMCLDIHHRSGISNLTYSPYILIIWSLIVFILFYFLNEKNNSFFFIKQQQWEKILSSSTDIEVMGQILFYYYPLPIILISLILLVAMIGAITLTLTEDINFTRRQDSYNKNLVSFDSIIKKIKI